MKNYVDLCFSSDIHIILLDEKGVNYRNFIKGERIKSYEAVGYLLPFPFFNDNNFKNDLIKLFFQFKDFQIIPLPICKKFNSLLSSYNLENYIEIDLDKLSSSSSQWIYINVTSHIPNVFFETSKTYPIKAILTWNENSTLNTDILGINQRILTLSQNIEKFNDNIVKNACNDQLNYLKFQIEKFKAMKETTENLLIKAEKIGIGDLHDIKKKIQDIEITTFPL